MLASANKLIRAKCKRLEYSEQSLSKVVVILELAFETKKLRTICEKVAHAETQYGEHLATNLRAVLSDIITAEFVSELPNFEVFDFIQKNEPAGSISLGNGAKIVFVINHAKIPVDQIGKIDWFSVRRIKIVEIINDVE